MDCAWAGHGLRRVAGGHRGVCVRKTILTGVDLLCGPALAGLFAVQLAKSRGATVIAHDKRNKEALVRGLGADEFIAAEDQPFEEVCGVVDVVLDLVPMGLYTDRSYLVCEPGARYVTPASQPPQEAAERGGFTAIGTVAQAAVEDLNELAAAIDAGRVKVFVEKSFPMAEVEGAMAYRQKGGLSGKVVLKIA